VPQVKAHVPPLHTWPAPQTVPQAPQLSLSPWVSAQARTPPSPVQVVSDPEHEVLQVPLLQTSPAAQAVPQAPQWLLSVASVAHAPLQSVWFEGHEVTQAPAWQDSPDAHTVPQAPQLLPSMRASTQRAPHAVRPV
jgi:hypothetical protein